MYAKDPGISNWWFGDPKPLLYKSKPLHSRVQWFLGYYHKQNCIQLYTHVCRNLYSRWISINGIQLQLILQNSGTLMSFWVYPTVVTWGHGTTHYRDHPQAEIDPTIFRQVKPRIISIVGVFFFQPIWKKCWSNWINSPEIGVKINNLWKQHLVSHGPKSRSKTANPWTLKTRRFANLLPHKTTLVG